MSSIIGKDISFSFLAGANYTFRLNSNLVTFFASSWSGKETVAVDGNIVSELRTFSNKATHNFELNGDSYAIDYETKSALKGGWRCSLYKNREPIKAFIVKLEGGNKHIGIASIFIGALFGVLLAALPDYLSITLPIFIVVLFVLNKFKRKLVYEVEQNI